LLATLFSTLRTNWAKIDNLIDMVQVSQPNFYSEYVKVRKIITAGTTSLSLKIKVTNAETGLPEANVKLTLAPATGQLKANAANSKVNPIKKKTAKGGGSNVKNLPDGAYTVISEKPGFKVGNDLVNVVNGEATVLEISLEKA